MEESPLSTPEPSRGGSFPLQVIPEAEISSATDQAIRQLLCECFPADADAFARSRAWHESAPAFSVICWQASSLAGHVGVVVRGVRCGEVSISVAGIQNMCVTRKWRCTGLAQKLMLRALDEARLRRIGFGLLFCEPRLELFYGTLGWRTTNEPVIMLDQEGRSVPIPEKNIAMQISLADQPLPPGPIDLLGPDW